MNPIAERRCECVCQGAAPAGFRVEGRSVRWLRCLQSLFRLASPSKCGEVQGRRNNAGACLSLQCCTPERGVRGGGKSFMTNVVLCGSFLLFGRGLERVIVIPFFGQGSIMTYCIMSQGDCNQSCAHETDNNPDQGPEHASVFCSRKKMRSVPLVPARQERSTV